MIINLVFLIVGIACGIILTTNPVVFNLKQPKIKQLLDLVTNHQAQKVSVGAIEATPSLEPSKQPSEKALKLAAYIYTNSSREYQKKYEGKFASQSAVMDKTTNTIRGMAMIMNADPARMASAEAWVEKHKAEASKPNFYVESPDINVPLQTYTTPYTTPYTPPKSVNCTSNSIGDYTYTNCF